MAASVDAYVACGGQTDKSGHVHRDTLVKIIKKDFGLPINIEVGPFAGHLLDAWTIFSTDALGCRVEIDSLGVNDFFVHVRLLSRNEVIHVAGTHQQGGHFRKRRN